MSATTEYDHLIFPQKLSSGNYLCVYSGGHNNVVGLICTYTYNEDTPEDYMKNEDMVDTMVDDIMEEMERKNGKICDNSYSSCGEEHEMYNNTYYPSDSLEQNNIDNIYMDL